MSCVNECVYVCMSVCVVLYTTRSVFCTDAWDLNSGLHASTVSKLLTEPSSPRSIGLCFVFGFAIYLQIKIPYFGRFSRIHKNCLFFHKLVKTPTSQSQREPVSWQVKT